VTAAIDARCDALLNSERDLLLAAIAAVLAEVQNDGAGAERQLDRIDEIARAALLAVRR
jgi:hypothetical protein